MNKDHKSVIGNIKEEGSGTQKSLIDRINMYNGCISLYLKGQRSWTEEKDFKYKVYNSTNSKEEEKDGEETSCKNLLGQIKQLLIKKYPQSQYK